MNPTVCLVCRNAAPLGVPPELLRRALQRYVSEHVGPAWGVGCELVLGTGAEAPPGQWPLYVLDSSDQAEALGYHTDDGTPRGYVFVATARADGDAPGEVAAHELAELLVDPACDRAWPSPRGRLVGVEVADAVEGPTFEIDGVSVANFLLPAWFGRDNPAGVTGYDHLGQCQSAWQILEGGYMPVWDGSDWTQLFGSKQAGHRYHHADRRLRRSHRRAVRVPPAERRRQGIVLA